MPEPIKKGSRYMPGLDGLRALALIGVMSYHWGLSFAPGGFLGVSVFFVLSGYLITDILASQWRDHGRLDLKDFWYRRFRRLLPAMFAMLLITVVWVTLFDRSRLAALREDVIAAVTYISNWQFIFQQVSYFESFGPPSPLGHMWSLAVEEQFYLLWPLIMLIGLRFFPRRGQMFYFIAAMAGFSALLMALMYEPGSDPSRVYFGTDTRAFGLLIGAALAIVWPSYKRPRKASPLVRLALDSAGTAALLLVLYMMWSTDRYEASLYQGGMVALSLAAAVVVAVLAHPASLLGRLLGIKPLRWIGVRSYGIYLWHYPVLILTSPDGNPYGISGFHAALQVAASIVLAALSWKYIEEPIRRGAVKEWWIRLRHPQRRHRRFTVKSMTVWCTTLLLIGIFCAGMTTSVSGARTPEAESALAEVSLPPAEPEPAPAPSETSPPGKPAGNEQVPPPETGASDDKNGIAENHAKAPDRPKKETPSAEPGKNDSVKNPSRASMTGKAKPDEPAEQQTAGKPSNQARGTEGGVPEPFKGKAMKPTSGSSITAIGDSVMVGVAPYLEKQFPGITIDAEIGRQMHQTKDLLPGLKAKGRLNGVVVIGLGTNGAFAKKDLEFLLDSLSSAKQVVLVNTKVPRDWERNVNSTLSEIGAKYPNTTLVDWHGASQDHPEYFRSDRVHLEPAGAEAYTRLLAGVLKK
ncbi:acyltransferase family protein [Paenibacillus sp. DMB20]|uniref:acyltransferase family protein n=1 Tax=Paenibacillus sp. DMB20 TaxID=1642570 RepID=UPI000627A192|nr:acyltransferase family protein [Paenibacillus sp. DMB20]KKO53691.1 acyltransferase [Paenibacillus sp. DMB20]